MTVVVVEPPAPAVDLDTAKAHLRVDAPDDDALIAIYLAAVQAGLEGPAGWLGRAIGPQTLELRLDGFGAEHWRNPHDAFREGCWSDWTRRPLRQAIRLPYPPLIDVVSITYEDSFGVDRALDPTAWKATIDSVEPTFGTAWPMGRMDAAAVRIRYRAGYVADATAQPLLAAPPAPLRAAILLMAADLYTNREAQLVSAGRGAAVENPTVASLLAPYRVWGV